MHMGVPIAICNYQVFLSFRGPDVRDNFLDCFYDQLKGAGIVAFQDRKEIEYGERIDDKIVEAIKRSYICVPVFSADFASSPACLMEVTQMVESGKTILPIFYGVEPSVVCYQRGTYEKSFTDHKRKNRYPDEIEKWKAALRKIAGEMGPIFKNVSGGYLELLKDFVFKLRKLLRMDEQDVNENLVGIDRDLPEMMRKLGFYEDGQVVKEREMTGRWVFAVWGLPGVGKTTLTKVVFNKISHLFEGCSFLENVRDEIEQKGVVYLQNRLICDLKRGGDSSIVESPNQGTKMIRCLFETSRVLIVLDDVDDFEQIKSLAELTWFGPRSRIILTTRRKDVYHVQTSKDQVISYEHDHEILPMNENHALELFRKCAFELDHPLKNLDKMSRDIISAVENLPFAIDIVGKFLYRKSENIWRQTLDDLKGELQNKVKRMLEANYELLGEKTREIFLDIACFFTGVEKTIPCYMWDARKRGPDIGVDELQKTSFLKIGEKNEFLMHGQLKFLGREIVKKENLNNPGERSRLWDYKDVQTTLQEKKGTNKVEALRVTRNFNQVDGEVFHHLSNLRFLELDYVDIKGNLENLPPKLVWLDWRGCHEKSKLFAFKMENLVILNLCTSSVKLNSEDWKHLMEKAGSLKVLNLKDCTWIIGSLQFPASRHLECLILEGCLLFSPDIQNSISNFENLVSLNMKGCKFVKDLPQALCSMKALKELLIDGTKIERLKFKEGSLPALEILSACKCEALGEVTDSIELLKNLRKLILRSCKRLDKLPSVIGKLIQLREMDLSDTIIKELPSSVKDLTNLEVLRMVHTYLAKFPEAIKDLQKLKELDFTHCRSLSGHCDITGLFSLRILRLKCTRISQVLARDEAQFCLHILELDDGITRQTLSSLPNLSALRIWECPNLDKIPPLLHLKELKLPGFPLESLQTSVATVERVIGIDDRVKDLIKLLEIEDEKVEVRIVGIYGTNGIGKTTIAKAVYDRLSSYFDSCSFLAEVGETAQNVGSIQFVQTKLISDILKRDVKLASFEGGIKFFLEVFRSIKVLIVLDDVEAESHVSDVVGDQLNWFGSGSRIIVTSENGGILQRYVSQGLARTYEVTEMDNDQALELFRKHALGANDFIPGYYEIGNRIIEATGQVPFAIEVMGSYLRGKTMEDWRKIDDLMNQRKQNSQDILKNCREILKICYEALDEKQKQIFWDIAWFANGVDCRIASYMWPDRDLLPSHHVLMPLAKIGVDNMLWMHKLLKRLSRTIDKEEYRGRHGRLYMHVSDVEVINRKEGMEEVEVLCFDLKNNCPHPFTETNFISMPNIRFLQLDHASMSGNFANVFPNLRWLRWQGCPRYFEAAEFNLAEAAIVDLSRSKVTEDWRGWRKIKMEQLKVLNLTACTDLLISPTFSSFPNLEILILERCSRLVHLDPSVGGLKKLLCLNLKSCTELNMLPAELVGLEALKELLIDETSVQEIPLEGDLKKLETLCASNCLSLSLLPHSFEHLTSLSILSLDNSKITKLPDGVGELVKLRCLSLKNCRCMRELPESIGQLGSSLEELDVSGTGVSKLPDSFGNLLSLRVLKMDFCFIREFPSFIGRLHSLEEIHAASCRSLRGEIPRDIGKLIHLRILRLQYSGICSLPSEIKLLSKLETLDLLHCDMLQELPALPSGLVIVRLNPKLKKKMSNR